MTMPKLKIKKGDTVIVLAGKNKGATGEVLAVSPRDAKVTVKGVNIVGRNQKPSQSLPDGGVVRKEMPLHVSNVAIADPASGKASRVGYKTTADGQKIRIARKSGETITGGQS